MEGSKILKWHYTMHWAVLGCKTLARRERMDILYTVSEAHANSTVHPVPSSAIVRPLPGCRCLVPLVTFKHRSWRGRYWLLSRISEFLLVSVVTAKEPLPLRDFNNKAWKSHVSFQCFEEAAGSFIMCVFSMLTRRWQWIQWPPKTDSDVMVCSARPESDTARALPDPSPPDRWHETGPRKHMILEKSDVAWVGLLEKEGRNKPWNRPQNRPANHTCEGQLSSLLHKIYKCMYMIYIYTYVN